MSTSFAKVDFVTFINALLGNKVAQKAERESRVLEAITTALKGNQNKWLEAYKAVHAVKNAKALQAAFASIGNIPVMYKPQDTIDAATKAANIAEKAASLLNDFEAAYLAICPLVDIKPTEAEKLAKTAEKEAKANEVFNAKVKELGLVPAESLKPATDGEVLAIALKMIQSGTIGNELLKEFAAVLIATSADIVQGELMNYQTMQAQQKASETARKAASKAAKTAQKEHDAIINEIHTLPATIGANDVNDKRIAA